MPPKSTKGSGIRSKAYNCIACNKEDNLRMVCCDNCDGWYHFSCVGVTSDVANRPWRCQYCSHLLSSLLVDSQKTPPAPRKAQESSNLEKDLDDVQKNSGPSGTDRAENVQHSSESFPSGSSSVPHLEKYAESQTASKTPLNLDVAQTVNESDSRPLITSVTEVLQLANPNKSKVRRSRSQASSKNVERLTAEMDLLREQQLILQERERIVKEKEELLRKKMDLTAQIEEENNEASSSDEEYEQRSQAQVDGWMETLANIQSTSKGDSIAKCRNEILPVPVANPSLDLVQGTPNQNALLNQILDRLMSLETKTSAQSMNANTSDWAPGMLPTYATSTVRGKNDPQFTNQPAPTPRITREQLTARRGVCKELPKFEGDPEEWPLFFATFEQTTALCGFSDPENLLRLRQSLEGKARKAVKNLLLHEACVPQIIATLRMKFGRPELIIDVLLSQIREMPPPKENRPETIVDFALEVQNICATMKASGMVSHLCNPELQQELVSKLPGLLGPFWGMHKLTLTNCTLEDFSRWLLQLAEGANIVMLPSTSCKARRRGALNTHTEQPSNDSGHHDNCVICNSDCVSIERCAVFNQLARSDKWAAVRKHQLCRRCLRCHLSSSCSLKTSCGVNECGRFHHPSLHKDSLSNGEAVSNMNTHFDKHSRILFRVLPITLHGKGIAISTFAFFDEGSSLTLIDESLVTDLQLTGTPQPLCLRWTADTHRYEDDSLMLDLEISETKNSAKFPLKDVHTVKNLNLPLQTLDVADLKAHYTYLKNILLKSYIDAAPKLLIGLNNCRLGVSLTSKEGKDNEPVAEKTRLGWTVKGHLSSKSAIESDATWSHFHTCDCEFPGNDELLQIVKNYICLDNLDVSTSTTETMSKDDQYAYDQMQRTTIKIDNRFETGLLWKHKEPSHPDSYNMALRRAKCLQSKLSRDTVLGSLVKSKIDEYLTKGYARKLLPSEMNESKCWYLPIFPVTNPNKPGKLRLVWDAAAKVDGTSLNSMLLKGPDQLTPILSAIRKFRQKKIAIGGDIAEMYHQVRIRIKDQNYQRFLWLEPGALEPTGYVMLVMTFGATCSPSCAEFIKNLNAKEYQDQFPRAVQSILRNHYVDDMLDSVDTEEEAIQLARDVHFIHSQGGFVMRNWVSNSKTVLDALETQAKDISLSCERELATEKVLGMWWSTSDDTLVFKISNRYNNNEVLLGKRRPTKREVLSLLMTVFDPLGLLGFFIMYAKIVFQEIWRSGCAWDELIHDHEHIKWLHWLQFLPEVSSMKIPRCYVKTNFKGTPEFEIHTFVDASEDGYAAVCYLRSTDGIFVDCALLGSKTRVAPLKLMSIPRLELQAAVIGARLAKSLVGSLSIDIVRQTFWSDSRTVLSWLRSDHRRYKQFVAFRVSEILELSEVSDWRWIPTSENVADEATKWQRTPDFSENSRWLNGPDFLKLKEIDWPIENCKGNERTDEELRVQYIGYHNDDSMVVERTICVEAERFSSWTKLLNVLSTVVNFSFYWKDKAKDNIQLRHNPSVKSQTVKRRPISQSDIQIAEIALLKKAQRNMFMDEILHLSKGNQIKKHSSIYKLSPYIDSNGLMRIGGRVSLKNGQDPIILPKCDHITELIVKFYHSKYYHCNHETVVNELRQKFWIPRLRTVLHRVRRMCQYCKNRSAKPFPPKMACLPKARLASYCRPFSYVGVDYFGPLLVSVRRSNEKRYGVLLTCLTTRAIHIEIAYSLSTDSCIIAIRNFIARRGCPIELWSDNGTNFKGAERELKEEFKLVDKSRLARAITNSSTKWNFIPPSSPHMGGAWERLVRSVKDVLRRIMPSRNPTDELLRGMLMEIEMIVNSRPLTYIPIDHEEDEALTPNHFLLGSSSGVKPLGIEEAEGVHLRRSWKITQQLANTFWKRWVTEYLPIITRRCKWFDDVKPIEVGDIVFIVDPDNPRLSWPKGRVVAVNLGVDGRVRSASVKTSTGVYERPATKIAVLDVISPKCAEIGPPEDRLINDRTNLSNFTRHSIFSLITRS